MGGARESDLELRHLRYFVTAAEEEQISRAAARLNIAQPALSRQIHSLEQELGVPLFERTPKGLRLSAAGRGFFRDACQVLEDVQRASLRAQRAASGQHGNIRIACSMSTPWSGTIPQSLRQFRAECPEVSIDILLMKSSEHLEAIRDNRADLGFIYDIYMEGADIERQPIGRSDVVVAVPEDHPLAECEEIRLSDLNDENLIMFRRTVAPQMFDHIMSAYIGRKFEPRAVREVDEQREVLALVSMGVGVGMITTGAAWWRPSGVATRPVADQSVPLQHLAVWRKSDRSPAVHALVSILRSNAGVA